MQTLFEPARVEEIKHRLATLSADTPPLWGKMTPAQAVAHCVIGMKLGSGEIRPKRMMIGRVLGPLVKSKALQDAEPMRKNSPTMPELRITDDRDLDAERAQLIVLIDAFAAAGPTGCTTHPHSFFGPLTPAEWASLMYKHLDHHLRQFGA